MKGPVIILLLVILAFPLSVLAQKVKYVSQSPGTFIKVIPQRFADNSSNLLDVFVFAPTPPAPNYPDTVFVGLDSGLYKANTGDVMLVLQKDGHRSKTQLVTDLQIRRNKRRVVLEKTEPLPYRKKNDASVLVEQVDLRMASGQYVENFYESIEDLEKREVDYREKSNNSVMSQQIYFRDRMNEFLLKTKYIDPSLSTNFNAFDRIKLKIVITAITEHKFSGFSIVEIKARMNFLSPLTAREIEKEYSALSNINYNANNKQLIEEALENAFLSMVRDPEMKSYFVSPELELKQMNDSLQELRIENRVTDTFSLEKAVNCIVSVLQSKGHANGCLISNNGYIVTNLHVIGGDTSMLYVQFNSGLKKKCRLVRSNPLYDLALLKVDTMILLPFKIDLSAKISVGAEAYVIAISKNKELGPAITKGIISAKRLFKDKTYLQFNLNVNENNSGGALVNKQGELLGIINSKLGAGVDGVNFALTASYIEEVLKLKFVR